MECHTAKMCGPEKLELIGGGEKRRHKLMWLGMQIDPEKVDKGCEYY